MNGAAVLLRVLGDVDEHGAGPTGGRDLVRGRERGRHVLGLRDQEGVLGDRHRDADDVDLLERVGAHQVEKTWPVMASSGTESM